MQRKSHALWLSQILEILRNTLPLKIFKRAEIILSHPSINDEDAGAINLLTLANDGREYPGVINAIASCAACNGPSFDLPIILCSRKAQRKYASMARDLLTQVERYSRFCGGINAFQAALKDPEGRVSGKSIPDSQIILSLQMIAEVFEMMATAQRKEGRPEDVRLRSVLFFLEDQFRRDFGTPHHEIIGRFWEATFPGTGPKDAETVRVMISNFRNPRPRHHRK